MLTVFVAVAVHRQPSHNCSASARGSAAAAATRRMASQAQQSRPMSLREKAAQKRAATSSHRDAGANTARVRPAFFDASLCCCVGLSGSLAAALSIVCICLRQSTTPWRWVTHDSGDSLRACSYGTCSTIAAMERPK